MGAELLEERADRRLRLGRREHEQLARDELVAALAGLLLGGLEQRAELSPRLDLLAALHLGETLDRVLDAGLQLGDVDAGAREQRLRAVVLLEHRGEHVHRLDVRVVACHCEALRVGQRLLELAGQFVDSHGENPPIAM